jgi:hypothetical protein
MGKSTKEIDNMPRAVIVLEIYKSGLVFSPLHKLNPFAAVAKISARVYPFALYIIPVICKTFSSPGLLFGLR